MIRTAISLLFFASLIAIWSSPVGAENVFPAKADARIVIAQDRQRLLIYERGNLVRELPISTGWPGKRETATPAWRGPVGDYWGTFTSFGTTQDDGYWLFTDYLPDGRWNGDILLHGAPYTIGEDGSKEYDIAGIGIAPISHGCIRLLPADMAWFRAWDPEGVEVEIQPLEDPALTLPKLVLGAVLAAAGEDGRSR